MLQLLVAAAYAKEVGESRALHAHKIQLFTAATHLPYPRFYLVLANIGPFTDFTLIVWTPR